MITSGYTSFNEEIFTAPISVSVYSREIFKKITKKTNKIKIFFYHFIQYVSATTASLCAPTMNIVREIRLLAQRISLFFPRARGGSQSTDTPSCTSCHSTDPLNSGRTRAGKDIAPMALSKTPARYTDRKKVEKWFRRNCKSVLGRICTPLEKGDIITFMISQ